MKKCSFKAAVTSVYWVVSDESQHGVTRKFLIRMLSEFDYWSDSRGLVCEQGHHGVVSE